MRIYLDHNAGAPLRPEAHEAMLAVLGPPANPSSAHREGARARSLLEQARADVAALVGARAPDVVFTSGATEANNLALRGVLAAAGREAGLVTGATEHASVLETGRTLERAGTPLTVVPVDGEGRIEVSDVVDACDARTALVSIGLANGEVGTVAPVGALGAALRPRGIPVHTDAAQAAGRLPIDVATLNVDLLSLSSHKLGGPAGAGALWVRRGTQLQALVTGGPQERGLRAGTENLAAVVGFAAAARAAAGEVEAAGAHMTALTARLWDGLRARIPGVARHGATAGPRLPNTLNIRIPGCAGESLLVLLDLAGVAVSLGSACAAGAAEPSHVLHAMGLGDDAARSALRLSLGPATTEAEIDAVIDLLPRLVRDVRARGRAGAAA
jgi:cysteine desulfurase